MRACIHSFILKDRGIQSAMVIVIINIILILIVVGMCTRPCARVRVCAARVAAKPCAAKPRVRVSRQSRLATRQLVINIMIKVTLNVKTLHRYFSQSVVRANRRCESWCWKKTVTCENRCRWRSRYSVTKDDRWSGSAASRRCRDVAFEKEVGCSSSSSMSLVVRSLQTRTTAHYIVIKR